MPVRIAENLTAVYQVLQNFGGNEVSLIFALCEIQNLFTEG